MRKLRRFGIALVLTLTLTTGAFGGIIETPPAPEAPPAPSSTAAVVALNVIQIVLAVR